MQLSTGSEPMQDTIYTGIM